jgi:hypothetical protein
VTQPKLFQPRYLRVLSQALILVGLGSAVMGMGATVSGQAQTTPTESTSPAADTAVPEPDTDTVSPSEAETTGPPLDRYTYADLFSIGVPAGWEASEQTEGPQVVLTNAAADNQGETVRIEITWHDQPPEMVVAQLLNDLKSNDYRVSRYETQGIDNTTALNIWLSDLPDDFPNAYMSYIGYTDTTAAVVSYYTNPNTPLAAQLVEIHESFERLD